MSGGTHVGRHLGTLQAPISYQTDGRTRIFRVAPILDGAVTPVRGKDRDRETVISNAEYWVASDITVARSDRSQMRAFGRNWDFSGRSAEICKLDWRAQ